MAKKFLTSIDLNKNELQNVAIQNLSSSPASPVAGQVYYNTTDKVLYQYNGTAWKTYTQSGSIANADIAANAAITKTKISGTAITAADTLTVTNGMLAGSIENGKLVNPEITFGSTPQALGSTVTNISGVTVNSTTVPTSKTLVVTTDTVNSLAAPSADFSVNNNKVTNVATPTADNDAANKKYVDDSVAGLTWKPAVNLLADTNVSLTGSTGSLVIDSHAALTATHNGYRLLLINQTTTAENGIYLYSDAGSGYTLSRSEDTDTYQELIHATVFVGEGTVYETTTWTQASDYLTSFSGQSWVQFGGGETITAGNGLTKTGTVVDVVGTTNRISVSADAIDISTSYAGQNTITTLGTVATGTWNATTIGVAKGGTGATTLTGYVKGSGTSAFTASSTIPGSDISGNISGTASNVSGTVVVGNGGTGATTLTSGGYLKGAGSSAITSQSGIPGADVSGNITGNAANVTGTVAVANGGTGSTTSGGALTNLGASPTAGNTGLTIVGTVTTGTWNATDIAITAGGTGASDAATARTNLGLAIGTNVQAYNATLAAVAAGTYTGDDSITTVGTISAGVWNGTDVAVTAGGTGSSTAAGARSNLGATGKYTLANSSITVSSGIATWVITAGSHGLGITGAIIVQMKEISSGAVVDADIVINESTGDITITWNSSTNITANTYRVTAIG